MLKTAQCQHCLQAIYPPKEVCPSCYFTEFVPLADHEGTVFSQIKNSNQETYISLVQTKHRVWVLTEAEQALPSGQPVLIQAINNKLISIPLEETNHEKNS